MGDAVSIYARFAGSVPRLAAYTMLRTGGVTCLANDGSCFFRADPLISTLPGFINIDVRDQMQENDPEDVAGTALEPYTHEIVIEVGGVPGNFRQEITLDRGREVFTALQSIGLPLLLADDDSWLYADFLPDHSPASRVFPAGVSLDAEDTGRWWSELYNRPPEVDGAATVIGRNRVVSFEVGELVVYAPAASSGVPQAPAFGALAAHLTADLRDALVDAAKTVAIGSEADTSRAVYASIANRTGLPISDISRADAQFIDDDGVERS